MMKKTTCSIRQMRNAMLCLFFVFISIAGNSQVRSPLLQHFKKGINVGTWISQYDAWPSMNYDTFITENDIKQIASWGMDHVRLPVDCDFIEENSPPYKMKEEGLKYVDKCMNWCEKNNLAIIIDLHKAPGFSFENGLSAARKNKNQLFSNTALQKRSTDIWKSITTRYLNRDNVIFELLNEVTGVDASEWNGLAKKCIEAIHSIDPDRIIMIGGLNFNSIYKLKDITVIDNPYIVYTFHFYDPIIFTHQQTSWVKSCTDYNRILEYPGEFPGLEAFLIQYPEHKINLERYLGRKNDKATMRLDLQPAVDFMRKTGREVYCGEFGVNNKVSLKSSIAWFNDLIDLMNELGIPRAVWNYKDPYFTFVNKVTSEPLSNELVKIVSG